MNAQNSGVSPEIAGFFQDPDASDAVVMAAQQIAAPLIQGAPLTMQETMMGGGARVVFFIFDASPSMEPVAALLREGFNTDFVPAVKAAREDDISALRIGGVAFSSGSPVPLWEGSNQNYFHPLDELPQLTTSDYNPNLGYGTALHRAILEGSAQAFKYAAELEASMGMNIDVDIVVLSDGADNDSRSSAREVKQMITGRDKTRVRFIFFYFETEWGLKVTRPSSSEPSELEKYVVDGLGFDGEQVQAFALKPGESATDRERRFRRLLNVMSRVSASRGTSAVVATASVLDDEEIV